MMRTHPIDLFCYSGWPCLNMTSSLRDLLSHFWHFIDHASHDTISRGDIPPGQALVSTNNTQKLDQ